MSQQVRAYRELDIKSGAVIKIAGTQMTSTAAELNKIHGVDPQVVYLTTQLADVSTNSSTYLMTPHCTVDKVWVVIDTTIANTATITLKNNADASMGTIALDNTTAGAGGSLAPAANATFTEGQRLTIHSDGASTTASVAHFIIKATRSS